MVYDAVLFDFDGTLADSLEAARRAYDAWAARGGLPTLGEESLPTLRAMSMGELVSYLRLPLSKLPSAMAHVRKVLRSQMATIAVAPGMKALLADLHRHGIPLAVVSSNDVENIRRFLALHEIEGVADLRCAGLFGKDRVLRASCRRLGIRPERALYVGDEVRDVRCARKAGCAVASVTWGFNDRRSLLAASPDHVVDSPRELRALCLPERTRREV